MPMHHKPVPEIDIKPELLDEFLKGSKTPGEVNNLPKGLKKAILERTLNAELTHHLGYAKGEDKPETQDNHRNGSTSKTILTDDGALPIDVSRDRAGTFELQIITKGERRFTGFDDKIIAMYARGMSVREIQGYLEEIYGVRVSPDFISTVIAAVIEEVREWQVRPLEALYLAIFFDALRLKIRDEGTVKNKAVYLALAILPDGTKDILGILDRADRRREVLAQGHDGAEKPRRKRCPDCGGGWPEGLPGGDLGRLPAHPDSDLHRAPDPRQPRLRELERPEEPRCRAQDVYRASDAEAARHALDAFDAGPWGLKYPPIAASWRRRWEEVIPFFTYLADLRKIIYTTNAIESLHMQLRKIIKTRGHFPSDEAATKLIYLALRNITKEWKMSARRWKTAMTQFAILFPEWFVQQL
jgi:putative transposase